MKTVLGIFCKQPIPGKVKTRLAADVGDVPAARLYEAFLRDIVERLRAFTDECILCYTPDDKAARDYFDRLAGDAAGVVPQVGSDLGTRLANFFEVGFLQDPVKVVVIGSDVPTITRGCIRQAFSELDRSDAVLGHSDDGGYYLIGLRRPVDGLFADVDWSTSAVFDQQLARLTSAGFHTKELAPIPEVDTIEDLHKLLEHPMLNECEHTCRVLKELKL